jgi:hypothetical protein
MCVVVEAPTLLTAPARNVTSPSVSAPPVSAPSPAASHTSAPAPSLAGSHNLKLPAFDGAPGSHFESWLRSFERYCTIMQVNDDLVRVAYLANALDGDACRFYYSQSADVQGDYALIKA